MDDDRFRPNPPLEAWEYRYHRYSGHFEAEEPDPEHWDMTQAWLEAERSHG